MSGFVVRRMSNAPTEWNSSRKAHDRFKGRRTGETNTSAAVEATLSSYVGTVLSENMAQARAGAGAVARTWRLVLK